MCQSLGMLIFFLYFYSSRSEAKEPIGPLVIDDTIETCLNYNEYVVYNTNLVKMRYLIRIEFR